MNARAPSLARNVAGWGALSTLIASFLGSSLVFTPRQLLGPMKAGLRLTFRAFGLRFRVRGLEHLEEGRTYLFMSNHVNVLDHFILLAHLSGYIVGLEAIEASRIPVYGWAGRRWGQIRIDRGSPAAARETCHQVAQTLAGGTNVACCPEGRHTRDGHLQPFKKGVFHIAVESGATILPIAIRGLHPLMPHPSKLVGSGEVEIVLCPPIPAPSPSPTAHEELSSQVHAAIAAALGAEA
ncbi:MAG: 1-acyl-sn-glycerol-3-phosphate acyltransferase [Sandaracinaceae bacterium]|nr:1-acyl-sn-glycerol-3-phosphate acyltransferase [Sandaracinaceae bacterium]